MTENPVPPGNPDFPPSAPLPAAGGPPYPYPYAPGPYGPGPYGPDSYGPGPYPAGPYPGAYPPAPYGDYYQGPPPAPKNGLGVAALVVAIIALIGSFSVVGGILLGIVAVILGFIARGRAKSGEATNGGVALAGIILGVVSIIAGLAFIAIWVSLFKEVGATDYFDCLEQAGQDRSAVQQCSDEFRQSVSERLSSAPTPAR